MRPSLPHRPDGEVVATHTALGRGGCGGALCWSFVMGTALSAPHNVTLAELPDDGAAAAAEAGVAWRRRLGEPFEPPRAADLVRYGGGGAALSLPLPAAPSADEWGQYTLWRTVVSPRSAPSVA